MNVEERISKLESLLARVRARVNEPRRPAVTRERAGSDVAVPGPVTAPPSLDASLVTVAPVAPIDQNVFPCGEAARTDEEVSFAAVVELAPPPAPTEETLDIAVDSGPPADLDGVEASVLEVEALSEPVIERRRDSQVESNERLIAATPAAEIEEPSEPGLTGAATLPPPSGPPIEITTSTSVEAAVPVEPEEELAPVSSQWPVAKEELPEGIDLGRAALPESGRLRAALPASVDDEGVGSGELQAAAFAPEIVRPALHDARFELVGGVRAPRATTFLDWVDATLEL